MAAVQHSLLGGGRTVAGAMLSCIVLHGIENNICYAIGIRVECLICSYMLIHHMLGVRKNRDGWMDGWMHACMHACMREND